MYRFAKIFQVLTVEEMDKESEPKTYLRPFKIVIALARALQKILNITTVSIYCCYFIINT